MADLSIVFDVAGGSSVSGESGRIIVEQLEGLAKNISANPIGIKFQIAPNSLKEIKAQRDDITKKSGKGEGSGSVIHINSDEILHGLRDIKSAVDDVNKALKPFTDALKNEGSAFGNMAKSGAASLDTVLAKLTELRALVDDISKKDLNLNFTVGNGGSALKQFQDYKQSVREFADNIVKNYERFDQFKSYLSSIGEEGKNFEKVLNNMNIHFEEFKLKMTDAMIVQDKISTGKVNKQDLVVYAEQLTSYATSLRNAIDQISSLEGVNINGFDILTSPPKIGGVAEEIKGVISGLSEVNKEASTTGSTFESTIETIRSGFSDINTQLATFMKLDEANPNYGVIHGVAEKIYSYFDDIANRIVAKFEEAATKSAEAVGEIIRSDIVTSGSAEGKIDSVSKSIKNIGASAQQTDDQLNSMKATLKLIADINNELSSGRRSLSGKLDLSDTSDKSADKHINEELIAINTATEELKAAMSKGTWDNAAVESLRNRQDALRQYISDVNELKKIEEEEAKSKQKAAAASEAADKKAAEALKKRIADAKKADAENAKKAAEEQASYIGNNPVAQNQYLSSISNLLKTTGAEYLRYTQIAENGTRNVIQGYESQEESVKALAIAMKDLEELRGMVENGEDMSTSDVSQLYTDAKAKIDMATEALFKYEQATGSVSSAETRRLEQLDKIQKAMNAVQAEMNAYTDEKTGYGAAGKETATYAEMERAYEALKKYHAEITATVADTGKDVVTNNQFAESFNKINARAKLAVDAAKAKIAADKESIKTTAAAADAEKRREEEQGKINQAMRVGETLLNKIAAAQRNWTAAASGTTSDAYSSLQGYADKVRQANRELSTGAIDAKKYREKIAGLSNDFDKTSRTIAGAGENMRSFGDRIGDITSKFGMWLSTSRIIMTIVRYLKQMITTTIELDDAMTQLRIVTGETDSTYEKFGNTVAESAKKLGVSMKDLIDATTTYSRLGLTNSPFVW